MLAHSMANTQGRDIGSDLSVHGPFLAPALEGPGRVTGATSVTKPEILQWGVTGFSSLLDNNSI